VVVEQVLGCRAGAGDVLHHDAGDVALGGDAAALLDDLDIAQVQGAFRALAGRCVLALVALAVAAVPEPRPLGWAALAGQGDLVRLLLDAVADEAVLRRARIIGGDLVAVTVVEECTAGRRRHRMRAGNAAGRAAARCPQAAAGSSAVAVVLLAAADGLLAQVA